jgi:hypothetical protein
MRIAVTEGGIASSPIHAAYEVGGTYLNADGNLFAQRVIRAGAKETFRDAWATWDIPIRNEGAVLATKGRRAWICIGAALYAVGRGWLP